MAQKEFHIETERLILRRYKNSDLEGLYRYLSDPETVRYEPYRPMSREEAGDELQRRIASNEMIAVELRDGGEIGRAHV